MKTLTQYLKNEAEMQQFAQQLAAHCQVPLLIGLQGDLGAGKTTLVRAYLRALGIVGPIKSPTYALVEPYQLDDMAIYHFDLYRLSDPEELELIGWRDYLTPNALWLIEWPEKAAKALPILDLWCYLQFESEGRQLKLEAATAKGDSIIDKLVTL